MARPKIVIATVRDGTPEQLFFIHVRQGMTRDEIAALLDLAGYKLKSEGPDGYIDDKIAQAATGPDPRPKLAIGTEGGGTADEKLVIKVRRGSSMVSLVGLLRLAEFHVFTAGVHGFLGGVEVAGAELLKKLPVPAGHQ